MLMGLLLGLPYTWLVARDVPFYRVRKFSFYGGRKPGAFYGLKKFCGAMPSDWFATALLYGLTKLGGDAISFFRV